MTGPAQLRARLSGIRTTRLGAVLATLVAWPVLATVLPHGAPAGIMLLGLIYGGINALLVVSIILVYRANRFINFAAAEFGAVAAIVAIELHIQEGTNYFVSVLAGLVLAAVLGALTEILILRRFSRAPRLIVAVATIGLAQLLNGLSVLIPVLWTGTKNSGTFNTPFSFHFTIFPVTFYGDHIVALVVIPVVLVALAWFLRSTSYGVAIRAAADNGDRARLMGVPVARLSTIVWVITGLLSALAVLLRVPIQGFASYASVSNGGVDLLIQTLTAAVIAGMTSIPVGVTAALGIGITEQLGAWSFQNSAYEDPILLVLIIVTLVIQRKKLTRATETGIATWQAVRPIRPIPTELIDLPEVRAGRSFTRLGLLAFGLTLPLWLSPARTQLATYVLIYAIVAVSLVVMVGFAGHITLGQIALMGFGGAVTADLFSRHGWDLFFAMGAAGLVAGLLAVLMGIPALRVSGPYLAIITLAFAAAANSYFLDPDFFSWLDAGNVFNRPVLFDRIATGSDRSWYYVCFFVLAASIVAVRGLRAAHYGRAIIASKENRLAAQSMGLNTVRLNLAACAISGVIAGLGGSLFVVLQQGFNYSEFDPYTGLLLFTMVVIGGLGSLPGAVLGAVYVYGMQYLLSDGVQFLATGVGLLLLLMILPGGLGELVFMARDALLRRVANRRGILVPSLVADRRAAAKTTGEDVTALIGAGLVEIAESERNIEVAVEQVTI